MKISETFDSFQGYLIGAKSPNTIKSYLTWLKEFADVVKDKHIEELNNEDIIAFKRCLINKKLSLSSISSKMMSLSSYAKFLKVFYKITPIDRDDIATLTPKVRSNTTPDFLEKWVIDELLENCKDVTEEILIALLFYTGMRASEMLSLTYDNIIQRDEVTWLKIVGKGNKERMIPLNDKVLPIFQRYIQYLKITQPKAKKLFNFSYRTLWYKINKIGKRIGIEIHPHLLRHSIATRMLSEGVDIRAISEFLGHSNLNHTARYAKVTPELLIDAVKKA